MKSAQSCHEDFPAQTKMYKLQSPSLLPWWWGVLFAYERGGASPREVRFCKAVVTKHLSTFIRKLFSFKFQRIILNSEKISVFKMMIMSCPFQVSVRPWSCDIIHSVYYHCHSVLFLHIIYIAILYTNVKHLCCFFWVSLDCSVTYVHSDPRAS